MARRRRAGPDLRRATALGAGQLARPADALARPGVHLLGGAARSGADRLHHDPARRRASTAREELFDIVFVMVVIYTLLTGPTLPTGRPGARGRPPLRAARPRGRGGAAGAGRRRPAPGHDQPGVADARRRGRRAAAAARRLGVDGDPRRPDHRARAAHRAAARRRPARGHPAQAARADRGAAAPGQRARPARPVAGRRGAGVRRSGSARPAGCRSRRRRLATTALRPLAGLAEAVADDDGHAGPTGSRRADPDLVAEPAGDQPHVGTLLGRGSRSRRRRPGPSGAALPLLPSWKPASVSSFITRPARPSRVPAL